MEINRPIQPAPNHEGLARKRVVENAREELQKKTPSGPQRWEQALLLLALLLIIGVGLSL